MGQAQLKPKVTHVKFIDPMQKGDDARNSMASRVPSKLQNSQAKTKGGQARQTEPVPFLKIERSEFSRADCSDSCGINENAAPVGMGTSTFEIGVVGRNAGSHKSRRRLRFVISDTDRRCSGVHVDATVKSPALWQESHHRSHGSRNGRSRNPRWSDTDSLRTFWYRSDLLDRRLHSRKP